MVPVAVLGVWNAMESIENAMYVDILNCVLNVTIATPTMKTMTHSFTKPNVMSRVRHAMAPHTFWWKNQNPLA